MKGLPVPAKSTLITGIPEGWGQFVFNDPQGNSDCPIMVYPYRPAAWDSSRPVLIVMHGAGRDGQSPGETWIPYAEQYSSLLVVPEFSEKIIPGTNGILAEICFPVRER
jgi:hypothetical protein